MSGPRSQPPVLEGYAYRDFLGDGGFADVFLYEKQHPQREVAIKVLRSSGLDAEARRAFGIEANLMAKVSEHPFIVTVYDAGTADDGRPYLVMEYYSEPHYGKRAAQGGIGVADVLKLGVQISGAVEVAHREGIIHRDIKPANILVNRYGRPGLTDFGIAGTRAGEQAGEGWSVPYAPPEILSGDSAGDEVSDVYSLAATLYTILSGRSPFAVTGGTNSGPAVTKRVLNDPVPPTRRADVPPALEHLLRQALSKDPASRPPSALRFARSLQGVQRECRMELTQVEVPEAVVARQAASDSDVDGTRAGRPLVLRPVASSGLVTGPPRPVQLPEAVQVAGRPPVALPVPELHPASDTVHRQPAPAPPEPASGAVEATPARRRTSAAVGVVAAIVVGLVAAGALFFGLRGDSSPGPSPGPSTIANGADAEVFADHPAAVTSVSVRISRGEAEVSWVHAGRKDGDHYRISQVGAPNAPRLADVESSPARVVLAGGCVQVVVVRGGTLSDPTVGCPT